MRADRLTLERKETGKVTDEARELVKEAANSASRSAVASLSLYLKRVVISKSYKESISKLGRTLQREQASELVNNVADLADEAANIGRDGGVRGGSTRGGSSGLTLYDMMEDEKNLPTQ